MITHFLPSQFIKPLLGALTVAMILNVAPAQAQESKVTPADELKALRQNLEPLLSHPLVAGLAPNQQVTWRFDDYHGVKLPDEALNHPEGVFRTVERKGYMLEPTPPVEFGLSGYSPIYVLLPGLKTYDQQECETRALEVLKTAFPFFWEQGPLPKPIVDTPEGTGLWRFEWERYREDEMPDTHLTAEVRSVDGKVIAFSASKFVREWKHKVKPSQAKQNALEWAAKYKSLRNVVIHRWSLGGGGGVRFYNMELRAQRTLNGEITDVYKHLSVDAETGVVNGAGHGWEALFDDRDPKLKIEAVSPLWSAKGLLFTSTQQPARMPWWVRFPPQLLLKKSTAQSAYLTADLHSSSTILAASLKSSWVVMRRQQWTYAFDLETGAHRILGMPERMGRTPTIDPDGKWAVVSGTGRDRNSDLDLLPDDLTARGERLGIRGRLVSKGNDHHPLFSPDNKWLYFVTSTTLPDKTAPLGEKTVSALRRIPAELSHTRGLKTLKPEQIQTIIPNLPGDVSRLSIYPNGQKLLLQTEKGMFNLSVAEKKATAIASKNLKDAEVNAPIIQLRDGWAGPSDNEVTFSGKTTDAAGKVRWRIYSCRFDGSSLKAWTPKENQSVEAYRFPKAPDGKTAIDLARQWALKEIEWEDYLKRQEQ